MSQTPADIRSLTDIRAGGCSAWQLPPDETCAGVARFLVRTALTTLGITDDLIHTAETLVSELATNALQHAPSTGSACSYGPSAGLPELWLYHREQPVPQLVITVFDAHRRWNPHTGPPATPQALHESGRGLEIVAALATCWGAHLTRSRLGPWPVRGKAVWATLPLPGITWGAWLGTRTALRRLGPAEAAGNLQALLAARGITHIYRTDSVGGCVLSLRPELTVWTDTSFRWRDGSGGYLRRPLGDVVDAAEQVIRRYEELSRYDELEGPVPRRAGSGSADSRSANSASEPEPKESS